MIINQFSTNDFYSIWTKGFYPQCQWFSVSNISNDNKDIFLKVFTSSPMIIKQLSYQRLLFWINQRFFSHYQWFSVGSISNDLKCVFSKGFYIFTNDFNTWSMVLPNQWSQTHKINDFIFSTNDLMLFNDLIIFYQGFLYTTNDSYKTNDFHTWKSNDRNQRYSTMHTNGFIVASNG